MAYSLFLEKNESKLKEFYIRKDLVKKMSYPEFCLAMFQALTKRK
jgi:hypothetical protein